MNISTSYQQLSTHIWQVPVDIMRFSEAELTKKPLPDKWSKKEIMGHLVDSARYNLMRFTEVLYSSEPYSFPRYRQADLVRINAYQLQPIDNIALLWQSLNQQILHVMGQVPTESLLKPIIDPDGIQETLGWLFQDYVVHLEHHLTQIFGKNGELIPDSSGLSTRRVSEKEALRLLEAVAPARFETVMQHGPMKVEYYMPVGEDLQQPHDQDELYVIAEGTGMFVNGAERHPFGPGDVLYVPSGVVHRFEDFSEGFATWVIFWGGRRDRSA